MQSSQSTALENDGLYQSYMSSEDTQDVGWVAFQNKQHSHVHEEDNSGEHVHIMMHNEVRPAYDYPSPPLTRLPQC